MQIDTDVPMPKAKASTAGLSCEECGKGPCKYSAFNKVANRNTVQRTNCLIAKDEG